jgi:replicative DNA helicase
VSDDTDTVAQLEMSVIGAVLLNADTLALLPSLETDDFQNYRPQAAWEAIRNLEAAHAPIDITTIGDELAKLGRPNRSGSRGWASAHSRCLPSAGRQTAPR